MVDKETSESGTEGEGEFEEFVDDGRTIKVLKKTGSEETKPTETTQETQTDTTEDNQNTSETDETTADILPVKFRGKSMKDVVDMYSNLERKLGEQGLELGELRKYAKELITSDFDKGKSKKVKVPEKDAFYEDGPEYVQSVVESKASVIEAELQKVKQQQAFQEFRTKHPDYADIGKSEDFREWVHAQPYRIQKFAAADNGDIGLADELISDYKEFAQIKQARAKQDENKRLEVDQAIERKAKMKKLSGESGKAPASTIKKYRSADLINLRQKNPDLYEQMGDEILRAYQEGRVK